MDPPYNQPPPSNFIPPASSSFSVPVPVFPTAQSFPPHEVVQVGGEQLQPTTADFSSVQAYLSSSPNSSHPAYNQMITAAILALKERGGSSRQAIAKYIERIYSPSLSSEHSNLLTQHLRRMKDTGQLVMVKHSYMLSGSAPTPLPSPAFAPEVVADMPTRSPGRPPKLKPVMNVSSVQQAPPSPSSEVLADMPKRSPGRPAKLKQVVNASSVQQAPVNDTVGSGTFAVPESVFASIGLVDGLPEPDSLPKRRPGRPKKVVGIAGVSTDQNVTEGSRYVPVTQPVFAIQPMTEVAATGTANPPVKRRPGRPPRYGSINVGPAVTVNRPRGPGRPKQKAGVYTGKPRGRPPRNAEAPVPLDAVSAGAEGVLVAHVGDGAVPMGSKRGRPGRPPKSADEPKKPSQLFGKPHKQDAPATTAHVSNLQQLLAYQELRGKMEFIQSRMKHTVGILKPVLESQTSSDANEALKELEELSTIDITAASSLHDMQLLPPNQVFHHHQLVGRSSIIIKDI